MINPTCDNLFLLRAENPLSLPTFLRTGSRVLLLGSLGAFLLASLENKPSFSQLLAVKFVFSKKATKIDEVFTIDLTLTQRFHHVLWPSWKTWTLKKTPFLVQLEKNFGPSYFVTALLIFSLKSWKPFKLTHFFENRVSASSSWFARRLPFSFFAK